MQMTEHCPFCFISEPMNSKSGPCCDLMFTRHKMSMLILFQKIFFYFSFLLETLPFKYFQTMKDYTAAEEFYSCQQLVSTGTQMSERIWLILFAEGCDTFTTLHCCTIIRHSVKMPHSNMLCFQFKYQFKQRSW